MKEKKTIEKEKKTKMTPWYAWALLGLVVILLAVILGISRKSEKKLAGMQQDYDELQSVQFRQDSVMNSMEDAFDEILYNLTFVQEKRGSLFIEAREGKKSPRKQIVEDVKLMDRMLHESEVKIQELQSRLRSAGISSSAYEQRISTLQEAIRQQNSDLQDLQQVISVQNFKISDLKKTVEVMDKRISVQNDSLIQQVELLKEAERQIYMGYVAYGTAKELKEKNLLAKGGAFLGIGGTKELPENFDQSYFMEIDMRDVAQISLHTRKAELITKHPADSYHLEVKDGEVKFLSIDKPKEFWKMSRFVVIQVK